MFSLQTFLKSLTAVKANCHPKRSKLFICFWSARFAHISFFSTFRHISRSETAHLPPEIILNVWKFLQRIFCWANANQVGNSSKLRMFGSKTCHVCTQLKHVFPHVYTLSLQPTVSTKLEKLPYFARIKTGPLRPLYCPDRQKRPLTLLKRQLSSFERDLLETTFCSANVECQSSLWTDAPPSEGGR